MGQGRRDQGDVSDAEPQELAPREPRECQWFPGCKAAAAARLGGFVKEKTAYEITRGLEFRRVLFRSTWSASARGPSGAYSSSPGVRDISASISRSEERRVGKECRSRWSPYH